MPNQRAAGQKLVAFPASDTFIAELDQAYRGCGYGDRSKFIRDAIVEKLRRAKVPIDAALALAPSRLGVGGKPTHRPQDAASSKVIPTQEEIAGLQAAAEIDAQTAKLPQPSASEPKQKPDASPVATGKQSGAKRPRRRKAQG